jgi:Purple acid Phosphatase, N-terminal domain
MSFPGPSVYKVYQGTFMYRRLGKVAIVAIVISVLCFDRSVAQILPPAPKAAHVKIIQRPTLEIAHDDEAIIRWTSTNPGGDDEHFAIAHYGTDPDSLSETAKSHIRLNRNHPETIFRVRMVGLKPQTTYYYWVTSATGNGSSDNAKSAVSQFTTPAPGKRIVNFPQPK